MLILSSYFLLWNPVLLNLGFSLAHKTTTKSKLASCPHDGTQIYYSYCSQCSPHEWVDPIITVAGRMVISVTIQS